MRIFYLTQHFPPEAQAASFRAYETAVKLADQGFEVFIITGFPSVSEQRNTAKYRRKLLVREACANVKVIRVFTPLDTKKGFGVRLGNYLSYMVLTIIVGVFLPRPAVVYASSPPFFVSMAGLCLAKLKRAAFMVEIRDLWLDFAILLEQLTNKTLIGLMRRIEKVIYNSAKKIVVVTKGYQNVLLERGVGACKVEVIYSGVDFDHLYFSHKGPMIREKYNLTDKFIVGYAGNVGLAQGLEVLIEAATTLKANQDVVFLIVGNGAEQERLMSMAEARNLKNIIFVNQLPREQAVDHIDSFDCCLVTLLNHPLFHITLPSKLLEYMALGKPVLLGLNGEAKNILEDSGGGITFDIDKPVSLVQAIMFLKNNPQKLPVMGSNGYRYVKEHFDRKLLVEKLGQIFTTMQHNGGAR